MRGGVERTGASGRGDWRARARSLRIPHELVASWDDKGYEPERVHRLIDGFESVTHGSLRLRQAADYDNERLADLFRSSPERLGDWEVVVDRSPDAFAQYRLQEGFQLVVLEQSGTLLASLARATRNAFIGGVPVTVRTTSSVRVREGQRDRGLSWLLRMSNPCTARPPALECLYVRTENAGALESLAGASPKLAAGAAANPLVVTAHHIPARPFRGSASGIRGASEPDLRRCVALINRTHRGLDLFRPYTVEFLRSRLDDAGWGPKPTGWAPVYGMSDLHVLEEHGRVVACGGIWDRGAHLREIWTRAGSDTRVTRAATTLLDFGFARGREDAMLRLLAYLLGRTHDLGRTELLAAVEPLPRLLGKLRAFDPRPEPRLLFWESKGHLRERHPALELRRPHMDLAYW